MQPGSGNGTLVRVHHGRRGSIDGRVSGENRRARAGEYPRGGRLGARRRALGPTALRIAPGAQLRRLRETSNITREEAAEAIRALYLDQPDSVIDYVTVMNQLCVRAETGTASKDMLGALLKQT